jgi:hypothetical protein
MIYKYVLFTWKVYVSVLMSSLPTYSLYAQERVNLKADDQTNLPHTVTEDSLGKFFAQYGPIGTLKIMWRMSPLTCPD